MFFYYYYLQTDEHPNGVHDPVDINKLSENIARATCIALVKLLDLLVTAGLTKLAVRATIHPENVSFTLFIIELDEKCCKN